MAVSQSQVLVASADLTGTAATRRSIDVTGTARVIIVQDNEQGGADGTAGIDVVVISKDGGSSWTPATDVLAVGSDDSTGTVLAGGALNAAGVEVATAILGVFKCGPYEGPTLLRICRKTATLGTAVTWVTNAPAVTAFAIGAVPGALTTVTHTSD